MLAACKELALALVFQGLQLVQYFREAEQSTSWDPRQAWGQIPRAKPEIFKDTVIPRY